MNVYLPDPTATASEEPGIAVSSAVTRRTPATPGLYLPAAQIAAPDSLTVTARAAVAGSRLRIGDADGELIQAEEAAAHGLDGEALVMSGHGSLWPNCALEALMVQLGLPKHMCLTAAIEFAAFPSGSCRIRPSGCRSRRTRSAR